MLINENALIGGSIEYFMTPLALIELGKYQWTNKDLAAALPHWQDATLVAARYEQYSCSPMPCKSFRLRVHAATELNCSRQFNPLPRGV